MAVNLLEDVFGSSTAVLIGVGRLPSIAFNGNGLILCFDEDQVISAGDSQTMLVKPHLPEGTASDFRFKIPIVDHSATLLLDIIWETPAPNNFLRLVLETDALETKELTLHAPVNLESHAITFTWSPNPELESH